MYLFLLPLIAVGLIIIPFIMAIRKQKCGKKVNMKKTVLTNALTFIGCMVGFSIMMPLGVFAEALPEAGGAVSGFAEGMKYLGAGITMGLSTIGTGIAVGGAAPAAIGATSEDGKNFTKALIFVALGEGVAIYGVLISVLILFS